MKIFNDKKIIVGIFSVMSILLFVGLGMAYYFYQEYANYTCEDNEIITMPIEEKEEVKKEIWHVEVKGAVKAPGVYEVNNNTIINDVISQAGSFTSKAYTKNINLSKKVEDEMVIYVYTQTEYNKTKKKTSVKKTNTNKVTNDACGSNGYKIDNCTDKLESIIVSKEETPANNQSDDSSNNVASQKININTASAKELMTLTGIGESKAKAIIEYRTQNGSFKSIEEIKKVSGIGDATYAKFKDRITI